MTDSICDPRPDELVEEMTEQFPEMEVDYRDADWAEIVYEDDEYVVVADHAGYELSEWANDTGVPRQAISEWMHTLARRVMGATDAHDVFSSADPIVFDKNPQ